ncbi:MULTISPECIES: helix-turn-helix transcriptional regulator [unclassified Streptomyces]|uniref:helix-turn-helix domain-containing protein n=1 Tax=unclassified Streptomyces TaxID=2593676 RepID=UPI002E28A817|nr:helix-turn-helix transcriptional regulator [Streptomyces sp. NBC_00285]
MALNPVANSARERFGAALQEVRLAARVNGTPVKQVQVARALGHKSYHRYSRIERGETWPKDKEWAVICDFLEMDDVTRVRLETMRSEGLAIVESAWWNEFADETDPSLIQFVTNEQIANKIITCAGSIIPGLFQTPDYGRTLTSYLGKSTMTQRVVERSVELRQNRRKVFERPNPPTVEAIIGEGALHQRVGGALVMARQLDALVEDAKKRGVIFRVIPFEANAALAYPFHLFEFGEGEKPIAAFDVMTGMAIKDTPKDVRGLRDFIGDLKDLSLSPEKSLDRIGKVRKEMSSD